MERMWKLPLGFWQFKLKMLDFFGGAGSTCPGQAAAKCLEMGAACQAFSYDQTWGAQLHMVGLTGATKNPAWTLWVKNHTAAPPPTPAPPMPSAVNYTDPPFILNQQ
jgi:hypothetical protein